MAKFLTGDSIVHKVFGEGEILDTEGFGDNMKLTIAFSDEKKVIIEQLTAFKRAGASMIVSYHSIDIAKSL